MPIRPPLLALSWPEGDRFTHLIGGQAHPAEGPSRPRHNPTHPERLLAWVPQGGPAEIELAVRQAREAFPAWRDLGPVRRGEVLAQAAQGLRASLEAVAQVMAEEIGKPLEEAKAELGRACQAIAFSAGEGARLGGIAMPSLANPAGLSLTLREPMGVVGLITPWNFPASILAWKLAPALVAGNAVVLKPSPLAPATTWMILDAFLGAGVPEALLQVVWGEAPAGQALTEHPEVGVLSFTGSTAAGRQVQQAAARHGARCLLELGGKNPAVVLADADLELAAEAIAAGAWGNSGQRCNATGRVLVHRSVAPELEARLLALAAGYRVGDPLLPGRAMGPMAEAWRRDAVLQALAGARAEGATLLCGGVPLAPEEAPQGHFLGPTLLRGLGPSQRAWREELFGPVLGLWPFDEEAEAFSLADDGPYGLSSSLFTRDHGAAMRFVRQAQVGMVHVNLSTTYSEAHLPFGGWKDSGLAYRESGAEAVEPYLQWKTVYLGG